jgi:hypothetical protein
MSKVDWQDLTKQQKEQFAQLCDRYVGIESVEDAQKYYGNKEKLIEDAEGVTK